MNDKRLAPHVERAMAVAQAKKDSLARPAPARPAALPAPPPSASRSAPHLAAALERSGRPRTPALQACRPPARQLAPHVAAAVQVPRPQAKLPASPGAARNAGAPPQAAQPSRGRLASAPGLPLSIQPYVVLGPGKIWNTEPDSRPYGGYPYILRGTASFKAQDRGKSRSESKFLENKNQAALKNASGNFSIRLSDDHQMAIEHSNLSSRQPKRIYLSDDVFRAANQALGSAGSKLKLVKTGKKSLTVVRGWGWYLSSGDYRLFEVEPVFDSQTPDRLPQNCNDFAAKIVGKSWSQGPTSAYNQMLTVLGKQRRESISRTDLENYAGGEYEEELGSAGLNEAAQPEIGQAFMIASLTEAISIYDEAQKALRVGNENLGKKLMKQAESKTWTDYFDGKKKTLDWPYHYAAVVAVSGNDRITLENYARGDQRKEQPDPRWYFQMYGGKVGQSFHEANLGSSYVNPITMIAESID